MGQTRLTRLEWLESASGSKKLRRAAAYRRGKIIRDQLEKAMASGEAQGFLRLAGAVSGPEDLSSSQGLFALVGEGALRLNCPIRTPQIPIRRSDFPDWAPGSPIRRSVSHIGRPDRLSGTGIPLSGARIAYPAPEFPYRESGSPIGHWNSPTGRPDRLSGARIPLSGVRIAHRALEFPYRALGSPIRRQNSPIGSPDRLSGTGIPLSGARIAYLAREYLYPGAQLPISGRKPLYFAGAPCCPQKRWRRKQRGGRSGRPGERSLMPRVARGCGRRPGRRRRGDRRGRRARG
jgi:hypothetical protein